MKISLTIFFLVFSLISNYVGATTISGTCKDIGIARSQANVAVSGINGYYYAQLYNGSVWSKVSKAKAPDASGIIRYVFDSNATVIAAGATGLSANYITGGKVGVVIRQTLTNMRIGGIVITCALG